MKNKTQIISVCCLSLVCALTVTAENPWSITVGPAARVGTKTKISSTSSSAANGHVTPDPSGGATTFDWDADGAGQVVLTGGAYFLDVTRSSATSSSSSENDETPMGFSFVLARDIVTEGTFDFGMRLGFSGYWGREQKASSDSTTDRYSFDALAPLYWAGTGWTPGGNYFSGLTGMWYDSAGNVIPSVFLVPSASAISSRQQIRTKSSLYQISVGPTAKWSPSKRFYVSIAPVLLLNLADTQMKRDVWTAAGGSTSDSAHETKALPGAGLHLQSGYLLTESWGIYGSVGYEYIEKADIACGTVRAETDFSSLVVSAGVEYRF